MAPGEERGCRHGRPHLHQFHIPRNLPAEQLSADDRDNQHCDDRHEDQAAGNGAKLGQGIQPA
ncbi:MAG: hypothetical protein V4609_09260 [Pseudomonadota bacterium]